MLIIYKIIAFLIAISVHEAAHAWMAYRLGDPTAKLEGRLSLNPLKHIDIYGTVIVPFFLILFGSPFVFGWAKPVSFDPFNLRNPRKDTALISLSGPMANFITASIFAIILQLTTPFSALASLTPLFYLIILINLVLGVFNLIPIHPLDGGKILVGILPQKEAEETDRFLNQYGLILIFILIFFSYRGVSPLNALLNPIINFLLNILIPQGNLI
ncbi:MAG: site-2 protease family protein [Patescibacteria group bacterium]|nr:MAG: site-2 protease family protein [Patescibacteria group bacterium]